jgi:hypothetical protein
VQISIENRFREVRKLVDAAQARDLEPEFATYFCKLGCVLVCGAIERSVEILLTERVSGKRSPQVASFLKSYFKRGTNYDCEEILELLHRFDGDWGDKFKKFIEVNEQVKSSVASCYSVRNSVAHGGAQSLGPRILKQYFDDAYQLIAELEILLKK